MEEGNLRKGPWYEEEDERLKAFVSIFGERRWDSIARASGLRRSGKSCRFRWLNYLRPSLKQGRLTPDEERITLQQHKKWGNKWAKIAGRLPGRTDNMIKNFWRTNLRKKEQMQNAFHSFPINKNVSLVQTSSSDQSNDSNQEGKPITTEKSSNNNKGAYIGPYYDINPKGLSDYMITNSPYENRLSDWITTLSSERNDELSSSACWESHYYDYPFNWSLGDSSGWDCDTETLWDMDLFTVNN